jgi:hypothetical protein
LFEKVVAYGYGYGYGFASMKTIPVFLTEAQALELISLIDSALYDISLLCEQAGKEKDSQTQDQCVRRFRAMQSLRTDINNRGKITFFGW